MTCIALAVLATGCATVPPPTQYVDKEPILVGVPISERIAKTDKEINEQIELLDRVSTGKYAGKYEVVQHNNGLDARVGSSRTLPKAYAQKDAPKVTATASTTVTSTTVTSTASAIENKIVKKIDWKSSSANELGKSLAKAMGYEFALKTGELKDRNIDFTVNQEPLHSVLDKFKNTMSPFAEVVVIKDNKTFNIIYK